MQMATVMMSTTMKPAFLMEAIVVDLMPIHNTAQNVNALNEGKARIQYRKNIILKMKRTRKHQFLMHIILSSIN